MYGIWWHDMTVTQQTIRKRGSEERQRKTKLFWSHKGKSSSRVIPGTLVGDYSMDKSLTIKLKEEGDPSGPDDSYLFISITIRIADKTSFVIQNNASNPLRQFWVFGPSIHLHHRLKNWIRIYYCEWKGQSLGILLYYSLRPCFLSEDVATLQLYTMQEVYK